MLPRLVGLETPTSRSYRAPDWNCDHQPVYHHHGPWRDHLFHKRLTCAGSRSRCSRPKRGQPKVPFSACRCHILVVDYQWGSMGSDETAITIPGGPRVIAVLYGTGHHRVQIIYFFRMQIGSRTPSRTGLGSGSRLDRIRRCLGLSRELWIQNFGDLGSAPMSG